MKTWEILLMETIIYVVVPLLSTSTLPSLCNLYFLFFFLVLIDTCYNSTHLIAVQIEIFVEKYVSSLGEFVPLEKFCHSVCHLSGEISLLENLHPTNCRLIKRILIYLIRFLRQHVSIRDGKMFILLPSHEYMSTKESLTVLFKVLWINNSLQRHADLFFLWSFHNRYKPMNATQKQLTLIFPIASLKSSYCNPYD